jgi:hypothetical protein
MKLIDRYVREIGRRLPPKSRTDIEKEIRSALEDMLEDRSKQESRAVDEEMTIQVLKEYGKPEEVAAWYVPERYLIGPQLFPMFWMVLRIVFAVLTVLALVGLGINLSQTDLSAGKVFETLGKSLFQYFGGMMTAFGNIVLVFAIIQWFAPGIKFDEKEEKEEWNPRDLPEVEESDQVSLVETIVEIVFSVVGLVIFNFYPEIIGFYSFTDKGSIFMPILTQAFFSYMPWINLLWGMQIALNAWLLQQMRWQKSTRWFSIAIKAGEVVLAYIMLKGPALVNVTTEKFLAFNPIFPTDAAQIIATLFSQVVTVALLLVIIINGAEIVKELVKMVRRRAAPA